MLPNVPAAIAKVEAIAGTFESAQNRVEVDLVAPDLALTAAPLKVQLLLEPV